MTQVVLPLSHLYNPQLGEQLLDEAIARVSLAAPPAWRLEALRAVYDICLTRPEFTTDRVWALLDTRGVAMPPEPRAIGAIMRAATRRGWCDATRETRKSARAECHRRPVQVWRSCTPLPAWDRQA